MTQNPHPLPPEPEPGSALQPLDDAPPPERPFPAYATEEEVNAFWDGVTHGIRQSGGPMAAEAARLKWRTDGWTPERQRRFVVVLSVTGSVKEACTEVGLSRESAYRLRRKPEGKLFARLWDAARLIARDRFADEAMERAMHGTSEAIVYHGEEVGRCQRHDNRHLRWTLDRLDREASRFFDGAAPARRAAEAFDALADMLGAPPEEAEAVLAIVDGNAQDRERAGPPEDEAALIARFDEAREMLRLQSADPADIDIGDLDPERAEEWTDLQWEKAERSGLLDRLGWDAEGSEADSGPEEGGAGEPPDFGAWSV